MVARYRLQRRPPVTEAGGLDRVTFYGFGKRRFGFPFEELGSASDRMVAPDSLASAPQ